MKWRLVRADVLQAVDEVVAAWTNPGPCPPVHDREKVRVASRWPTLARAVSRLVIARGAGGR